MQTRAHSLLESLANIALGYGIALLSQLVIFPWYGIHIPLHENLAIGAWFTVISLARSYAIRRWFTRRTEADDLDRSALLHWLISGNTGVSSLAMARTMFELPGPAGKFTHPYDYGDFKRCIEFIDAVPGARARLPRVAALSPVWRLIIDHWDILEGWLRNDPHPARLIDARLQRLRTEAALTDH